VLINNLPRNHNLCEWGISVVGVLLPLVFNVVNCMYRSFFGVFENVFVEAHFSNLDSRLIVKVATVC